MPAAPGRAFANVGTQQAIGMGGQNGRPGAADMSTNAGGHNLAAEQMAYRQRYVQPALPNEANGEMPPKMTQEQVKNNNVPYWMNQYDGASIPRSMPTDQKERLLTKAALREAASKELSESKNAGVIRTDPIGEDEIQYMKSMEDMSKLARFDEYVESLIDPKLPGNMKWLMEIYPDYVSRRLQQAHTDYEYALRNQMIDQWGINTFDDLHFKFMVDQGEISGPDLTRPRPTVDSRYTPGYGSIYNWQPDYSDLAYLPYASSKYGRRPAGGDKTKWSYSRAGRPLGEGNTKSELAHGMYDVKNPLASRMRNSKFGSLFDPSQARP